ncbi:hypothetical protein DIPPA_17919 [Diplonema papillatum]|nr:hypothetical protein DIPPA_17919 [Diplonema papillatum]
MVETSELVAYADPDRVARDISALLAEPVFEDFQVGLRSSKQVNMRLVTIEGTLFVELDDDEVCEVPIGVVLKPEYPTAPPYCRLVVPPHCVLRVPDDRPVMYSSTGVLIPSEVPLLRDWRDAEDSKRTLVEIFLAIADCCSGFNPFAPADDGASTEPESPELQPGGAGALPSAAAALSSSSASITQEQPAGRPSTGQQEYQGSDDASAQAIQPPVLDQSTERPAPLQREREPLPGDGESTGPGAVLSSSANSLRLGTPVGGGSAQAAGPVSPLRLQHQRSDENAGSRGAVSASNNSLGLEHPATSDQLGGPASPLQLQQQHSDDDAAAPRAALGASNNSLALDQQPATPASPVQGRPGDGAPAPLSVVSGGEGEGTHENQPRLCDQGLGGAAVDDAPGVDGSREQERACREVLHPGGDAGEDAGKGEAEQGSLGRQQEEALRELMLAVASGTLGSAASLDHGIAASYQEGAPGEGHAAPEEFGGGAQPAQDAAAAGGGGLPGHDPHGLFPIETQTATTSSPMLSGSSAFDVAFPHLQSTDVAAMTPPMQPQEDHPRPGQSSHHHPAGSLAPALSHAHLTHLHRGAVQVRPFATSQYSPVGTTPGGDDFNAAGLPHLPTHSSSQFPSSRNSPVVLPPPDQPPLPPTNPTEFSEQLPCAAQDSRGLNSSGESNGEHSPDRPTGSPASSVASTPPRGSDPVGPAASSHDDDLDDELALLQSLVIPSGALPRPSPAPAGPARGDPELPIFAAARRGDSSPPDHSPQPAKTWPGPAAPARGPLDHAADGATARDVELLRAKLEAHREEKNKKQTQQAEEEPAEEEEKDAGADPLESPATPAATLPETEPTAGSAAPSTSQTSGRHGSPEGPPSAHPAAPEKPHENGHVSQAEEKLWGEDWQGGDGAPRQPPADANKPSLDTVDDFFAAASTHGDGSPPRELGGGEGEPPGPQAEFGSGDAPKGPKGGSSATQADIEALKQKLREQRRKRQEGASGPLQAGGANGSSRAPPRDGGEGAAANGAHPQASAQAQRGQSLQSSAYDPFDPEAALASPEPGLSVEGGPGLHVLPAASDGLGWSQPPADAWLPQDPAGQHHGEGIARTAVPAAEGDWLSAAGPGGDGAARSLPAEPLGQWDPAAAGAGARQRESTSSPSPLTRVRGAAVCEQDGADEDFAAIFPPEARAGDALPDAVLARQQLLDMLTERATRDLALYRQVADAKITRAAANRDAWAVSNDNVQQLLAVLRDRKASLEEAIPAVDAAVEEAAVAERCAASFIKAPGDLYLELMQPESALQRQALDAVALDKALEDCFYALEAGLSTGVIDANQFHKSCLEVARRQFEARYLQNKISDILAPPAAGRYACIIRFPETPR